ncbi:unnamed protein product [Phyllotreta striolata]|uniref:Alpha-amylase n=1 Tax=Phyllotreta striolata TaxID=444603 RepID=A0A9N9TRW6_PHYSR|nr:unnamed protein product [Phyllotreta striolata]
MARILSCIVISLTLTGAFAQKDPHFAPGRNTIVHLFEWHWADIANECENFLGPKGYAGVQVSPPSENTIIGNRPWWERYQPISYNLVTRSGDENAFADMVRRCNNVGVRIYVDALFNDMSATSGQGTGGNSADVGSLNYPAVPYSGENFHSKCDVNNYQDPNNIRNCWLSGLPDLDQSQEYVRGKLVDYMNHLVSLGVAGFRIDAAKHMWPQDLQVIFSRVNDVSMGGKPFFYQEVIDLGGEGVKKTEYIGFGTVLEFKFGNELGNAFQGHNPIHYLKNWGPQWGLLEGTDAVAFIDNHDNQRHGSSNILTYKNPKPYKMAIAFMLAHPYGTTRVMSSYSFDDADAGPPPNQPSFNADNSCNNGWVCEHRWRQVYNMVGFRNVVAGTDVTSWWDNGDNQIAFSRGDKGFVAFTVSGDINQNIPTTLPDGSYCDIISGDKENGSCSGKTITVSGGQANVNLSNGEDDGVVAIHVNSKL